MTFMSKLKIKPQKRSKHSTALKKQIFTGKFTRHDLPFTCNPVWGDGEWLCPFKCLYCYTQKYYDIQKDPNNEKANRPGVIKYRSWLPEILDHELSTYNKEGLPQYLKRVQVNEAFEYYIPEIMKASYDSSKKDLLWRTLEVFERHWHNGNKWMIHLLTKSPLILKHLPLLQSMRQMIQVELTLITLDEKKRLQVEPKAPSVKQRLDVIEQLSDAGIFVRVMAMPFMGDKNSLQENLKDAEELKHTVLSCGAQAFDIKCLNYSSWDEIIRNKGLIRTKNREDVIFEPLLFRSGNICRDNIPDFEKYLQEKGFIRDDKVSKIISPELNLPEAKLDVDPTHNPKGSGRFVSLPLPTQNWTEFHWKKELESRPVPIIDYGYSIMNDVNWGYIFSSEFEKENICLKDLWLDHGMLEFQINT